MPNIPEQSIKTLTAAMEVIRSLNNDLGHERLLRDYLETRLADAEQVIWILKQHIELLKEERQ